MNEDQDIEKLFRESFEGFELTPPANLKKEIDKKLDFKEPFGARKIWFFGMWIALLAFLTIGAYFYFSPEDSQQKNQLNTLSNLPAEKNNRLTTNTDDHILDEDVAAAEMTDFTDSVKRLNETKKQKKISYLVKPIKQVEKKEQESKLPRQDKKPAKKTDSKQNKTKKVKKPIKTKASDLYKKNKSLPKKEIPNKNLALNEPGKNNDPKSTDVLNGSSGKSVTPKDETPSENGKTDPSGENGKTITPNENENPNPVNTENPKDEISPIEDKNSNPPKKVKKPAPPLMLSLKTGTSFVINPFSNPDFRHTVKESGLFNMQLEATYNFNKKMGVSSGINYYSSKQTLNESWIHGNKTLTGIEKSYITQDSIQIIPNDSLPPDTITVTFIVDSTFTPIYQTFITDTTRSTSFSSSSISIPFLFSYNFGLSEKLNLDLMAGGLLHFQQIKFSDINNPANAMVRAHNLGLRLCLKTHLRYQWDHFGVSVSSNFGYDFGSAGFPSEKRHRYIIDLGIGLHYKF